LSDKIDDMEVEFVSLMLQRAVSEMAAEVCDQCGKCASSCPVAMHMEDFNPRRLIVKVSLGRVEELLNSYAIWTCTSCMKCAERCPENISPYDVILALRNLAVQGGYPYPDGYDETIDSVLENGVAQLPQRVRTRSRERRDRSSLGLPPPVSPRDMETFRRILGGIVRAGRAS
jgi:heterodisulfide reductase subunit C